MAGVTRILAVSVVVGAAAGLAAAAMAAPGDPKRAFRPADQSYARTALLRKADLAGKGWTGTPTDFGQTNPACVVAHYSLSALTATAEAGTTFTRPVDTGTFLAESDAYVFLNAGQARTTAAIFAKLGFARCLASTLVAEVPAGSIATSTVQKLSVTGLATAATGFKIVLHITSSKGKSTLTGTVIALRRGRAFADLTVLTLNSGWSQATVRAAAAKIASHMATRTA